ncbi:unnamed protein product [Rhizophagus irregularis]|nr:unnamed protein product [Rhizophagus irregularis]
METYHGHLDLSWIDTATSHLYNEKNLPKLLERQPRDKYQKRYKFFRHWLRQLLHPTSNLTTTPPQSHLRNIVRRQSYGFLELAEFGNFSDLLTIREFGSGSDFKTWNHIFQESSIQFLGEISGGTFGK